jgi:dTDP-4-dehydrorhamnose reductase
MSGMEKILKIDQAGDFDVYLNLLEPQSFDYSLLANIDFVIFTAAISGPDKCADEYDFCWGVNVTGTEYFISKAIEKGCRVVFFSSDAVFGDIKGAIYTEVSETGAETPYGRMKKSIEDSFIGCPNFKAIRLSYVVSAKDRFVSYCLECVRKKEVADVYHPFYRNCVSVTDVVDSVVWLMTRWDEFSSSVLNLAGIELVSRIRIADEINRILDQKLNYSVSTPEAKFYQNRPAITQMRSLFLAELSIIKDCTFTEKIQKELGGIQK